MYYIWNIYIYYTYIIQIHICISFIWQKKIDYNKTIYILEYKNEFLKIKINIFILLFSMSNIIAVSYNYL